MNAVVAFQTQTNPIAYLKFKFWVSLLRFNMMARYVLVNVTVKVARITKIFSAFLASIVCLFANCFVPLF
jgi:hypothetical protein